MTRHAEIRSQQRGFSRDILQIIIEHGRNTKTQGDVCKLFFGKKEYSDAISELKKMMKILERAKNSTIVIGRDQVVTVYKKN